MKVAKKNKKEKGVSEVLGSILVLLITVTLFSSVFYYVSTMPTPKQSIYTEFDAQIVLVNANGNSYANITIKNVGGESLRTSSTKFIVMIESTPHSYYLSQGKIGTQPFAKDGKFSQGESFYYNSSWDGEPVTSNTNVYVMLYDVSNSKVIWSQRLQGQANLPPIVVGVLTQPSPIVIGKYGKISAIVFDPDSGDDISKDKVTVDLSSLGEGSNVAMSYSGGNIFTTNYIEFSNQSLDVRRPYKVVVTVTDPTHSQSESYSFYITITKGTEVSGPDIVLESDLITLSNMNPTHHSDVTVSVTVQNRGGTGAEFKLEIYDIYHTYPNGALIKTSLGNPIPSSNSYFSVAAAGQTTITFLWEDIGTNSTGASLGPVAGYHQLLVKAIDIRDINGNPGEDPNANPNDDQALVNLTVLPKILFVDDDQSVEGTPNDVSRYYKYILDTCSYSYDTKTVLGETTLSYTDYLKNYDLIIWETGYYGDSSSQSDSAISGTQMSELRDFLNHGGSLWLNSPELSPNYLNTYLGITGEKTTYDGKITGVANPDIDLKLPNGTYVEDQLANDRTSTPSKVRDVIKINSGANSLISGNGVVLGAYKKYSGGGKLVYLGFEFSRIRHYYNQNFIGYRILLWLGNLTGRAGVDVAVDDMMLSTDHPLYMEPVKIKVIVSNNGDQPISTQVMLKIDDVMSNDITTQNPNTTKIIPPNGGFVTVNFTWIPTVPGKHVLTVIADPYNVLKETNEENNILNGGVVDNVVYVQFSTLLIYNTTNPNDDNLQVVRQAFQDLNYAYKELNVHDGYPDGYADGTYFTSYNLVIWVQTDDLSTTQNKIGTKDAEAIIHSLNYANIGFMFLGSHMPELMDKALYNGQSLLDFFGVSIAGSMPSGSYAIFGENDPNSPTNGLAYVINSGSGEGDTDLLTGEAALFREYLPTTSSTTDIENAYSSHTITSQGYGVISQSQANTKCAVIPIDPDNIVGIVGLRFNDTPWNPPRQARAELTFHMLKYFGQEDLRPELAVYEPDIVIDYSQPIHKIIVSHTYMLRATVYNYGETGASTLIRFFDDYEWIGTKSVYIPGNSNVTVEIAWTPMFAGHARHIRVIVDPLNSVKEIQNSTANSKELFNYNNEAIKTVTVWYFWDDMEHGAENWMHEATIAYISGESPLDFLNRKDVSTNVVGNWDWSISGSSDNSGNFYKDLNIFFSNDTKVLNFTGGTYHTAPASFWMPEAPRAATRKPVDMIFVIDTSGSMKDPVSGANVGDKNGDGKSNTRIDVAIASAEDAVSELSDIDRVAIFAFDQNGNGHPEKILDFTYTTQANIQNIIDPALESLQATGGTPLYDTTSYATYYMDEKGRNEAVKGILVMTDGLSNSDDYGVSNGNQYIYAPGTGSYETEDGIVKKYVKGQSSGLLDMPYSVMAISIAPNGWDGRLFALGNSSKGNVSMALFESDPDAIEGAFTTFVSLLTQTASVGGIRAVQPVPLSTRARTISSLGAVVFADGFRAYADYGGTGTPDDANTPGFYGKWTQSGFTIASTGGDGNYYYKSQSSSNWHDTYWVAQTDTDGAYLQHTVYPYDVLKYHYPGSYQIEGANISFWVGVNYDDYGGWFSGWTWPKATIDVYANGVLIKEFTDVLDGSYEEYLTTSIPSSIYSLNSYNIKIVVSSTDSYMAIDDVMVVYYIDYTPPSSGSTSGGVPADYLKTVNTRMNYTFLITPTIDTDNAKYANLTFWTKYWMTQGTNGGIIYLWGSNDPTSWSWDSSHRFYLTPKQSYTGNLKFSAVDTNLNSGGPNINGQKTGLIDANGNHPYWCFNGRSGHGTFSWEYIQVGLTPYISQFRYIRIVFLLAEFGGLIPSMGWNPSMGWYIDDVKISVTSDTSRDIWQLHNFGGVGNTKAHSGKYAWEYNISDTSNLPAGVDSSLITKQIDLSTARTVNLIFWIRFNINNGEGIPPATIRVEISSDNGATWRSITYGVRIGWNASGTDKILHNGKSYSGIPDTNFDGVPDPGSVGTYGWVESTTLMRINCNLSGWAGNTILLRFRAVTNATGSPTYDTNHPNDPYGIFIDDVFIYGESYSQTIPAKIIWT